MKQTFNSNGIVLGNYWGGGSGSYKATTFHSGISKEDLINQNEKALENGSLDSGMGYESLIGALIVIQTVSCVEIDGEIYTNKKEEDLSEERII